MRLQLSAILMILAVLAVGVVPAEAVFVSGTASNSIISVGKDLGSPNQADTFGDIVASYTSVAGNDTTYKSTAQVDTVAVKAIFGDTVDVSGSASSTMPAAGSVNFTLKLTNFSNQSDMFTIDNDTLVGGAKDSVTIRVNGAIIYQGGVNDTFLGVNIGPIPPLAETQVTITFDHQDTNGAVGQAATHIRARANNGSGGELGGYIGNNGDNYAGFGDDGETLTVTVNMINILMRVDQDTGFAAPGTYNGAAGDSVPGSTLTYVIRYDNDGNDTALGFQVTFRLPANTSIVDTPTVLAHNGGSGTVLFLDQSDSGVALGPSVAKVKVTYTNPLGSTNGDANGTVDAAAPDIDAGSIKFRVYIK